MWAGFEPRAWDLQPFPFRSEIKDSSETQRKQNKPTQQKNQTLGSQRPGGYRGRCSLPHMSCKTLQDVTHFVFHVEMIPEMQLGPPPSFAREGPRPPAPFSDLRTDLLGWRSGLLFTCVTCGAFPRKGASSALRIMLNVHILHCPRLALGECLKIA